MRLADHPGENSFLCLSWPEAHIELVAGGHNKDWLRLFFIYAVIV